METVPKNVYYSTVSTGTSSAVYGAVQLQHVSCTSVSALVLLEVVGCIKYSEFVRKVQSIRPCITLYIEMYSPVVYLYGCAHAAQAVGSTITSVQITPERDFGPGKESGLILHTLRCMCN